MRAHPATSAARNRRETLLGRDEERWRLARLLDDVRGGHGGMLLLVGEPGIGKTALLDYLCDQAPDFLVCRTQGVRAEQELAYAALHRLVGTFVDRAGLLPDPQRALRVALGMEAGEPPAPLAVSLGALALLQALSAQHPVLCVVDDQQWLDQASMSVLAFVGRRLERDRAGLVFASRTVPAGHESLPALRVAGLSTRHTGDLLDSTFLGPFDPLVRRQIIAEAGGNPSTVLELFSVAGAVQLAGGYAFPGAVPVPPRLNAAYRARLEALPVASRRLVELAAADPVGDPRRLWAAAELLGLDRECLAPAVEGGFVVVDTAVRFTHLLARAAAYGCAGPAQRRRVHGALAAVTDPDLEPDRRAWHRAQAADGLDEDAARELERCAAMAQRRGGLAAAAAFRARAAFLTPDRGERLARLITAAEAARDAGSLDAVLDLLALTDEFIVGEPDLSRVLRLRGQVAMAQHRTADAVENLLAAAPVMMKYDPETAREVYIEALVGAIWMVGTQDVAGIAAAAAVVPPEGPAADRAEDAVDLILRALRTLVVDGYGPAVPTMRRAVDLLTADPDAARPTLATLRPMIWLPVALWDDQAWPRAIDHAVACAQRDGALAVLRTALEFRSTYLMWVGDLDAAADADAEACRLASSTCGATTSHLRMLLAAWQGDEAATLRLAAEIRASHASGMSTTTFLADYAEAVLFNATGRFGQAYAAARRLVEAGHVPMGTLVASELADAASRSAAVEDLRRLDVWLRERVQAVPGPWVVGIAERVRALRSGSGDAEAHYRRSIEQLRQTRSGTELARSELMFGEWLRRQGRRGEAKQVLRDAHRRFRDIGAEAFSERAVRALRAAGDPAAIDAAARPGGLTAQEAQIAALAAQGLTNPEIGARLFISGRTVQYHLRKVFLKLGITSRIQLAGSFGLVSSSGQPAPPSGGSSRANGPGPSRSPRS